MPNDTRQSNQQVENSYTGRVGLVYARVSSKKQELEGHGKEGQENRCLNDLEAIGTPYDKSFLDTFTGGGDFMKRPKMREMLAYIDTHPHKKFLVVFDDLKRFARDTEFHLKLRAAFKARDVVLRCLNYNFDESPEGRFAETIMAAQGELERFQNRRQVIQKQRARLDAGYWPFGAKKGYVMVKDALHGKLSTPHPTEALLLKEALEGFARGIFIRRIDACRFLVEKGFWKRPPEKYIDRFSAMVKDSFYAGYIEYEQWDVARRLGHHKGIISLETFEINQKRLGKDAFNKRIRIDTSPDYPLRGLVVCICGQHLTAAPSKGRRKSYPYYVCHNKSCEFYGKSIRKADIEEKFDLILKKQGLKPEVEKLVTVVFDRVWGEKINTLHENSALLLQEKRGLEEKAKQLTDMVLGAKSGSLKNVYETQLEEVARKIEEWDEQTIEGVDLTIPYRTALNKATGLLRNPYIIWKNLEVGEKQKLFHFIFERKLIYNKKEGYRTAEISSAIRLFEEFAVQNTDYVDPAGFEPATSSMRMTRSTK